MNKRTEAIKQMKGAGKRKPANELKVRKDSESAIAAQAGIPSYLRRDRKGQK